MAEKTVETPVETQVSNVASESTRANEQFVAPPVDIYETEDGLVLLADLPGVTADKLNISVKDDILTIEARTEHSASGTPVYCEFELPSFFRQFQLSEQIDSTRISASLKHGVLTLQLPKAEAAKPKTIKVEIA